MIIFYYFILLTFSLSPPPPLPFCVCILLSCLILTVSPVGKMLLPSVIGSMPNVMESWSWIGFYELYHKPDIFSVLNQLKMSGHFKNLIMKPLDPSNTKKLIEKFLNQTFQKVLLARNLVFYLSSGFEMKIFKFWSLNGWSWVDWQILEEKHQSFAGPLRDFLNQSTSWINPSDQVIFHYCFFPELKEDTWILWILSIVVRQTRNSLTNN